MSILSRLHVLLIYYFSKQRWFCENVRACRCHIIRLVALIGFLGIVVCTDVLGQTSAIVDARRGEIPEHDINVPPQPLGDAILEFALQTGMEVAHLTQLTESLQSPGVVGRFSIEEGLKALFSGTGLVAVVSTSRAILIRKKRKQASFSRPKIIVPSPTPTPSQADTSINFPEPQFEEMLVYGKLISGYSLSTTRSSTKTERSLLETPQQINIITAQVMEDRGIRDYVDASLLASSVSFLEKNAGVLNELRIRGFAFPALRLDGFTSHAFLTAPDVAFIERIEIAKGPNSALFGRMEPGGLVNLIIKAPGIDSSAFDVRVDNEDFRKLVSDINLSLTEKSTLRVVGFDQVEGRAAEFSQNDKHGLMIALGQELGGGSSLLLNARLERREATQRFGSVLSSIEEPPLEFFRNEEGDIELLSVVDLDVRTSLDLETRHFSAALNDGLIGSWAVNWQMQYDVYQSEALTFFPFVDNFAFEYEGETIEFVDVTEDQIADPLFISILEDAYYATPIEDIEFDFEDVFQKIDATFLSSELTFSRSDTLGSLGLEQLYGINFSRTEPGQLSWQTHDNRGSFNSGLEELQDLNNLDAPIDAREVNFAPFGQWVFNPIDRFTLLLGIRADYFDINVSSNGQSDKSQYTEFSRRAGVTWRALPYFSIYANYSDSFVPQFRAIFPDEEFEEEVPAKVEVAEPAHAKQVEWGIKLSAFSERLLLSCAVFSIHKRDIVSDINEQKNQGRECDVAGELLPNLQLLTSVYWLDAEIVASADIEIIGNRPRVTPDFSSQLTLVYSHALSAKSSLDYQLGYRQVSERFGDDTNEFSLSSYEVIDLGLGLALGEHWDIQVNVVNVTDKKYEAGVFDNFPFWVNLGVERRTEISVRYQF